ncbi:Protein phosphatase 1 regulatory subunit pprA, partial [Mucuna pruriens]
MAYIFEVRFVFSAPIAAICVGRFLFESGSISLFREGNIGGALRKSIYYSGQLSRDIFTNQKRLWSFDFRKCKGFGTSFIFWMARVKCFSLLPVRKEKHKGNERSSKQDFGTLLAKLQSSQISSEPTNFGVTVSNGVQKNSRFNARVMSHESLAKTEAQDGDSQLIKRELSDSDLQAHEAVASKEGYDTIDKEIKCPILYENQVNDELEDKNDRYSQKTVDTTESGHVSDPGIGKADLWASPKFKRHFSNLEKFDGNGKITHHLPPSKSKSFENFQELSAMVNLESPRSVMSHYSADRVMLKRHSSSQVLPSGSKKLWWNMILWSHRNIHRTHTSNSTVVPASAALNSGYSSDTLEPKQGKALRPVESSDSIPMESFNKRSTGRNIDNQRGSRFQSDQWIAFSTESSSFTRVDAWVKGLEIQQPLLEDDFDDDNAKSIVFPPSPDAGGSMMRTTSQLTYPDVNVSKETLNAISVVQSLNPASTIAHISGIGIKAIPSICHLSNLRNVNLSNNFIVQISPGYLPKGIQTLNLSRNKISTLEGLKELTKLRVLDINYNRISRIGQGLSSCILIKELYLVGNKISDVEGLHRLMKLTVLDLSFNKISTTKALGQLVANYNSLQALNLLGNPIQSNTNDDQLNKAVCGLLPKLVFLNKQPLKAHRTREIFSVSGSVTRAALGNNKRSSDKRSLRRIGHGGSSLPRGSRRSANVSQENMNRTRRYAHKSKHVKNSDLPDSNQRPKDIYQTILVTTVLRSTN